MKKIALIILGITLLMSVTQNLKAQTEEKKDELMLRIAGAWQASLTAESSKDYDLALSKLQECSTLGGDPYMTALRGGWLYYSKRDYENAAKSYKNASAIQPQAINPLVGRLNCMAALGDAKETLYLAENITRIDPANYTALITIASSLFTNRNYRNALGAYQKVLSFYPEDTAARSGEAWSYLYSGDNRNASASFRTLLTISPTYAYAQQGLEQATGRQKK